MTVDPPRSSQIVWLNGHFMPAHDAAISPFDRGFLYGDGLFETMRAENGCVLYLREHLDRLFRSGRTLRIELDTSLDWPKILQRLLQINALDRGIAVAKIVVTRGIEPGLGLPQTSASTVMVTVNRYIGPDLASYSKGWRLHVHNEGYATPLACYKTLNYLYYLTARQAALDAGADEAIILDAHGNVAETAAGSLLVRVRGQWWRPRCAYQLHGTTVRLVGALLTDEGRPVGERIFTVADLVAADTVWVLNSLMGIMPVGEAAGQLFADPLPAEAERLRNMLFERGRRPDSTG